MSIPARIYKLYRIGRLYGNTLISAVIVQRLFGIPLEFYYAIAIACLIWYVLEFTAIGRRILFVGRGREVARLSGIAILDWFARLYVFVFRGTPRFHIGAARRFGWPRGPSGQ